MSPGKKKKKKPPKRGKGRGYAPDPSFSRRTRYPSEAEVIGVVIRNLGARRMDVLCADQVKRVARIPGRFRRGYRITVNDVVLVEPWNDLSGDRGDITYRYRKNEIRPLSRRYKKELDQLDVEIPRVMEEPQR
ncbi:MAG: translation initiation factor IF-1A [Candidatus Hodarchaeales archaeon]